MKQLLILSTLFQGAVSHYTFAHLLVNDTEISKWKYIRNVTNLYPGQIYIAEYGQTIPYVPNLKEGKDWTLRCGRDAEKAAPTTETATIIAGTEVGFRKLNATGGYLGINHLGPAQVYMHRTDDLANDIGDGDWFKISYEGPLNDTYWKSWVPSPDQEFRQEFNFTIPLTTPPGTYLLRMEHMMPFDGEVILGYSQWFVNCAHVNIVGPGGGTPGPMVRIPEVYKEDDPGINLQPPVINQTKGLDYYVPPGPPLWTGA